MTALRRTVTALAGALLGIGLTVAPTLAVAPSVDLQPDRLQRGADIAVPHVDGTTIIDGDRQIRVRAAMVTLLGTHSSGYVVGTSNAEHEHPRIWRIAADGTRTLLLRGHYPENAELSDDGRTLAAAKGYRPTTITVVHTTTGARVAQRKFPGVVQVLDVDGDRVALGTDRNGRQWNTTRNRVRTRSRLGSYRADLSADLLASFTKDPYRGGCTRLSRFRDPTEVLWTSCTERIDAISPSGLRIATVDLLSDGIGPGVVWQRTLRGTLIARYSTGWFGLFGWEDADTMLLHVNGKRTQAIVRCTGGSCENATDPAPLRQP